MENFSRENGFARKENTGDLDLEKKDSTLVPQTQDDGPHHSNIPKKNYSQ